MKRQRATIRDPAWGIMGLVVAVLFITTGGAFAGPPPVSDTVNVTGTVLSYASIIASGGPLNQGAFTGQANEEKTDGSCNFSVETNAGLDLKFEYDLAHETEGTPLITYLKVWDNGSGTWLTGDADDWAQGSYSKEDAQAAKTMVNYSVTIKAKTGAISDQAAGDYTGAVTLTVSQAGS